MRVSLSIAYSRVRFRHLGLLGSCVHIALDVLLLLFVSELYVSCSCTQTRHGLLATIFAQPQLTENTKEIVKPTENVLVIYCIRV